jgi:hypothetical protein
MVFMHEFYAHQLKKNIAHCIRPSPDEYHVESHFNSYRPDYIHPGICPNNKPKLSDS